MSKCRSCGAEIIWIKMKETRKLMPVDAEPFRFCKWEGNPDTFITKDGEVVKGIPSVSCTGYISHFATCPNADKHRRR